MERAGCLHCLECLPCALTYELCDTTRRKLQIHEKDYQPWWPASIDSPTLYFHLKRRAIAHQFQQQALVAACGDAAVWRPMNTSVTARKLNVLRAARFQRQLALRLPAARTNLNSADELEFVGCIGLEQAVAAPGLPLQQQILLQALQQTVQQQQQQQAVLPFKRRPPLPLPSAAQQHLGLSLHQSGWDCFLHPWSAEQQEPVLGDVSSWPCSIPPRQDGWAYAQQLGPTAQQGCPGTLLMKTPTRPGPLLG